MRKINAKIMGQTAIEYAVFFICVVTGLLAMQAYITRSMQGKMRSSAESISEKLYAPEATTGAITVSHKQTADTQVHTTEIQGVSTTTSNSTYSESEKRTGSETSTMVRMP
jgi:hypothetical protein